MHHQNNGDDNVTDSTDNEDKETGCQFTPVIQETVQKVSALR